MDKMGRACRTHGEGEGERARNAYRILVGKPKERHHEEDIDVGGRIILK
jgi:hypothetical protein